jgi:hypothetical protein
LILIVIGASLILFLVIGVSVMCFTTKITGPINKLTKITEEIKQQNSRGGIISNIKNQGIFKKIIGNNG